MNMQHIITRQKIKAFPRTGPSTISRLILSSFHDSYKINNTICKLYPILPIIITLLVSITNGNRKYVQKNIRYFYFLKINSCVTPSLNATIQNFKLIRFDRFVVFEKLVINIYYLYLYYLTDNIIYNIILFKIICDIIFRDIINQLNILASPVCIFFSENPLDIVYRYGIR